MNVPPVSRQVDDADARYSTAKKEIKAATGLHYTLDESVLSQWGSPDGGYGAVQALFTLAVEWKAFDNPRLGAGSFQFYYIAAQYWSGATGLSKQSRLKLNSPINDYPVDAPAFAQASYTHDLPGRWLAVTGRSVPDPLDQIGLGLAWNKTNMNLYAGSFARQSETMTELYWATTFSSRFQVTADIQLYFQPALSPNNGMAAVFTVRAAALF